MWRYNSKYTDSVGKSKYKMIVKCKHGKTEYNMGEKDNKICELCKQIEKTLNK